MIDPTGTRQTIKMIVALVCGAAILGFGMWVVSLQKKAAVGEQRGAVITTTAGVTADGTKDDVQRTHVDEGVTTGREVFKAAIEKAKHNEPATASRSDRAVPDSVRNAARERRLARERSVGGEGQR